jgi:hypothetical protein
MKMTFIHILLLLFIATHLVTAEPIDKTDHSSKTEQKKTIKNAQTAQKNAKLAKILAKLAKAKAKLAKAKAKVAKEKAKTARKKAKIAKSKTKSEREKTKKNEFTDPTNLSENALFKLLFGSQKPKEVNIDLVVSVYIDTVHKIETSLQSNTRASFFKLSKTDFLRAIKTHLKKKAFKKIKKKVSHLDTIDGKWLTKHKFKYLLKASKQTLFITTPENLRGTQIIDFENRSITLSGNDLKPYFFSAFSNINYFYANTNFTEIKQKTYTKNINFNNHVAIGDFFIDSHYVLNNQKNYFNFLELNSFLFTKKHFTHVGFLEKKPIFGVNFNNSFINSFTRKYRKNKSLLLKVNNTSQITIFSNNKKTRQEKLAPGKYKLKNLPTNTGPNSIKIKLHDNKTSKELKTYTLFDYKNSKLLYPLEYQFDVTYGLFDNRSLKTTNIRDRLNKKNKVFLYEHYLGLFSLTRYLSNITHFTKYSNSPYLTHWENTFHTGTPLGILSSTYSQSYVNGRPHIRKYIRSFPHIRNYIYNFPNVGKYIDLKLMFLPQKLSKLLSKWYITLSKENATYRSFSIETNPISPDSSSKMGKQQFSSIMAFKSFYLIKVPFILNKTAILYDNNTYSFITNFSIKQHLSKNMSFNLVCNYLYGNRSSIKSGPSFALSFTYKRLTKKHPMSVNTHYTSKDNRFKYKNNIRLANTKNNALSLSHNPEALSLTFSNSTNGFNNNVSYSSGDSGDTMNFNSSLNNSRTSAAIGYTKQLSGGINRIYTQQNININSTLYMVGPHIGIGSAATNSGIAIIKKHKLLKESIIRINKNTIIDKYGPATIGKLSPFSSNSFILNFDDLPETVDITRANLNLVSDYGKGYYTTIGTKSALLILGTLINQNNDPIALQFIEITGLKDKQAHTLFTNKKGRFQFNSSKHQNYSLKVIDLNAEPITFSIPKGYDKGLLKLGKLKLIKKL